MAQPQRNSVQWCAMRLLSPLGVTSLAAPSPATSADSSNKNYVTPGLLDDLAGMMTAALQDIAADGPALISEAPQGLSLYAPATITLTVLPGNAATQIVSGWLPWMVGCTVVIQGDGYLNEFVNGTGRLRRPYSGATQGNVTATVFCNAVRLDIGIKRVLEPVTVGGGGETFACGSRTEFDRASGAACNFQAGRLNQGVPRFFFVETEFDEDLPYMPVTMRFAPCPTGPLPVNFRAKLNPPTINTEDIGTDTYDPAIMLPGVAGSYTESIFLPYCLQLLTGHPLWKPDNPNASAEIARRFTEAKKKLAGFKPSSGGSAGSYAYSTRC